jgi:MoaA/NifB/PqqE/SkfB family radical SAM enzyme
MLKIYNVKYTLFTNGTYPEILEEAVVLFAIKSVNISLDGPRDTYRLVRGFDGYDQVIRSIDAIKDKTNLQISFTASPWNSYEDYLYVKDVCARKGVRLMFNIYSQAANDGVIGQDKTIDNRYEAASDFPYTCYYNRWVKKEIKVPCYSLLFNVSVFPSGDVNLCVCKFMKLGNLYKDSIDEIWNSEKTKKMQRDNLNCNDCWVSCFRQFDIKFKMMKGQI